MQNNYFQTSDFPLATTLASLGFQIESLDRTSARVEFCFENTQELNEAVQAFWRGNEIKVDPQVFVMNQKLIKSRLYSEK